MNDASEEGLDALKTSVGHGDLEVVAEVTSAVCACARSRSGISRHSDPRSYDVLEDPELAPWVRSVSAGLGLRIVSSMNTGNYYAVAETKASPFAVTTSELFGDVLRDFLPSGEGTARLRVLILTVTLLELASALFDDRDPGEAVRDVRQEDLFARVERRMGALRESGASVGPEERSPFYDGAVAYLEMKAQDDERPQESRRKATRKGLLNAFVTRLKVEGLLRVEDGFIEPTDYFNTVGPEVMLAAKRSDAYDLIMDGGAQDA